MPWRIIRFPGKRAVLPNLEAALCYAPSCRKAYPKVIDIVRRTVASGLIYLPSSAKDFQNPEIDRYLAQYVLVPMTWDISSASRS